MILQTERRFNKEILGIKGFKIKRHLFSGLEQEINKTVISCDHKFDPFVLILSLWILSMNWW